MYSVLFVGVRLGTTEKGVSKLASFPGLPPLFCITGLGVNAKTPAFRALPQNSYF